MLRRPYCCCVHHPSCLSRPLWQDQVQQGPKRNEENQRLSTPTQVPGLHHKYTHTHTLHREMTDYKPGFILSKGLLISGKECKHLHKDRHKGVPVHTAPLPLVPHLPGAASCVRVAGAAQSCLTVQPCDKQSQPSW